MGFVRITSTIQGLQEAQARNLRRIAAMKPDNAPGHAAQIAATILQRYAVLITHVDTGAWRSSHLILEDFAHGKAQVFVNPYARNPRSNARVIDYAKYWEDQGGDMAVYQRTINEEGSNAMRAAIQYAAREIMRA